MILSDRVSGKVSLWGVLAAGSFALAAVPKLVIRAEASSAATSAGESGGQVDQDASATADGCEEIEAN